GGQLDVPHPLAADLGAGHLDATALADDALEADPLVLTAVTLPVPGGTEDLLAEQPVLLRLQGPVVDRLGLLDLAVGPLTDVLSGGQADAQLVEEVDVEHLCPQILVGSTGGLVVGQWTTSSNVAESEPGRLDRLMPRFAAARSRSSSSESRISIAA